MQGPLNIEVRDSVFDLSIYGLDPFSPITSDTPKIVYVRSKGSKPTYKVWLYLFGNDVPYVESVTYTLHATFSEPVRTIRRTLANPNCQLVIWTWGLFEVKAAIRDKTGGLQEIRHNLTYGRQLELPGIHSKTAD